LFREKQDKNWSTRKANKETRLTATQTRAAPSRTRIQFQNRNIHYSTKPVIVMQTLDQG